MLGASVQTKRSPDTGDLFLQIEISRVRATGGTCSCGVGGVAHSRMRAGDELDSAGRGDTIQNDKRESALQDSPGLSDAGSRFQTSGRKGGCSTRPRRH
jgi:hypothetical protein